MEDVSFFEKFINVVTEKFKKYRIPFLSAIILGLIAYGFAFTNKLIQQDDVVSMFGKGASLTSGRWGLEIMSLIFPDYSMPWVYGILTLIILGIAVCFIIKISDIKNVALQALFAGLFVTVSTVTGMFCLPFLSTSYATSALFAVLAVYFADRKKLLSLLFMTLSIGIYQAYVSLAASIMIVVLIKGLLVDGEDFKCILKKSITYLAVLVAAVLLYVVVCFVINKILNVDLINYGTSEYGILKRIRVAYTSFLGFFFKGYFSLVNGTPSLLFHIVLVIAGAFAFVKLLLSIHGVKEKILAVVLLVLLPLAINCMYLASSVDVLGALVFHGFTSIYLLAAVLFDGKFKNIRGIASVAFCIIIISNIYFSNEVSLKMYLQTSNATSFYQGVIEGVISSDEYEPGDEVAIIGETDAFTHDVDEIDTSNFLGLVSDDAYNIYSRYDFIREYLGFEGPFTDYEIRNVIKCLDEYKEMPAYPAEGSIKKICGIMVVKLE